MRQELTALKAFTYAGRALVAGDPFRAPRADARALRALGRAAPAGTYQTTALKPTVTKEVVTQAPARKAAAKKAPAKKAPAKKAAAK